MAYSRAILGKTMCVCHAPEMQLLGLTRLRSKSPPAISEGSLLVPVDPKLDQADLNSRHPSLFIVCPENRVVVDWPPILEMHDSLSFVFLKAKNVSNILA